MALHHYTDALSTMGEAGDPLALVEVSILLGEVLQDSGRIEEALERYREALVISEANDLRMQIGELLARREELLLTVNVVWSTCREHFLFSEN